MKLRAPAMPRFNRNASLLMAVSGLLSISNMGVHALLRVLYVLRLGHGPEYVGVFSAVGALTYTGMSLPSGFLGERFGARKAMLAGTLITVAGMFVMPLTEFVPGWAQNLWPIASQAVVIAGWSMVNVNLVPALMAVTSAEERAGAYATSWALRSVGTLVGTVSGGMLPGLFASLLGQTLESARPYGLGLCTGAALGLISLIPIMFVKEAGQGRQSEGPASPEPFPLASFMPLAVHVLLTHGGWATCQAFCNAYMDTALRLPSSAIGLIAGAAQLAAILGSFATPRLSARYGKGQMLITTALGTGLFLLPLALASHWLAASLGRVGVFAMEGIWMPVLQVFQMEQVAAQWRSRAYGVLSMVMGFSFASASLGGGRLITASGYGSVFLMGAGLCAAGAALLWASRRREENRHARAPTRAPTSPPAGS